MTTIIITGIWIAVLCVSLPCALVFVAAAMSNRRVRR